MKLKVKISEIRRIEKEGKVRIGQGLVNSHPKPASLMLGDEIRLRQELFYLSDDKFWTEKDKYVEIDWKS